MADEMDLSVEVASRELSRLIDFARQPIAVGVEGECRTCGRDWPRLVGGRCAPCRDGRRP
ncbi:conjugal transfer protein TraR [Sphingomonas sp. 1185]|uniref:conjugal transfer protein TraR n=1 Tax=Sphingomonas sp. 1185 TaxID=3156411 RepID=UPI003392EDE3